MKKRQSKKENNSDEEFKPPSKPNPSVIFQNYVSHLVEKTVEELGSLHEIKEKFTQKKDGYQKVKDRKDFILVCMIIVDTKIE